MIRDYRHNILYDDYTSDTNGNTDTNINEDESNICFICFEYKLTYETRPIHLSQQIYGRFGLQLVGLRGARLRTPG